MSILNEKHFLNEKSAIKYVENIIWKNGKKCHHCQNTNQKRIYEIKSTKARLGTHKCADCKKQFTVKVGTVFEQSHIPLYKWLQACFLMSSSKKGISSHQLHRTLEITYKSAWFLAHRIREAMKGIYQHCKSQHLKRYLCEFDFRYNRRDLNDVNRAVEIVANAFGKRLKYKEVLVA
jgi:transposase-like protein